MTTGSGAAVRAARMRSERGSSMRTAAVVLGTTLAIVMLIVGVVFPSLNAEVPVREGSADSHALTPVPDSGSVEAPGEVGVAEVISAVQAPEGWNAECVDGFGNPTVYALTELSSDRLEKLLHDLGFEWAEQSSAWSTGHAVLCAFDGDEGYLDAEELSGLDIEGGDAAAYQFATSDYSSAEEAYSALVSRPMTSEDSEFGGSSGFGVAYGDSMVEYLVEVTQGDGYVSVFVFGPGTMQAGMFDELAKGSYGSTAREAFESVTGHAPGEQE